MKTLLLTPAEVETAAEIINNGGVVAAPTETVYGLLADATREEAVLAVFRAKGRDEGKPLSVFVPDMAGLDELCDPVPEGARRLAERYFPGPITLVLNKKPGLPEKLTAGGDTLGVRCPDNKVCLELLRLTGRPLTGTSANLSGRKPAMTGREAFEIFDGRVDAVIDGGAVTGGVPSTVVRVYENGLSVLRQGAVSEGDIIRAAYGEADR